MGAQIITREDHAKTLKQKQVFLMMKSRTLTQREGLTLKAEFRLVRRTLLAPKYAAQVVHYNSFKGYGLSWSAETAYRKYPCLSSIVAT